MNSENSDNPIVSPIRSRKMPLLAPVALMTATLPDLYTVCNALKADMSKKKHFDISRIYIGTQKFKNISVIGPFVGAPYAVMLLEQLILYGVKQIIFIGWCGSISEDVKIGDIILPKSAYIDEGTSKDYGGKEVSFPDAYLLQGIEKSLIESGEKYQKTDIWTADAIYRETIKKVKKYQKKGAKAVEMEASALFSAGKFKKIKVCSLLATSDELHTFKWKPGFMEDSFISARKTIAKTACNLAYDLIAETPVIKNIEPEKITTVSY
ncbi:MAG: nucleoside phosphorylase [Deltaproteobacteria bacterium]|nr:nucleoside phosphorylase [Deltaproteobacteria bacterium]